MLWGRVCFCHGRVFTDAGARSAHELAVPLSKEHRQKIVKKREGVRPGRRPLSPWILAG